MAGGLDQGSPARPGLQGEEPRGRHWFEDLADHLGPAYLRYSFTKGTEQEAGFLVGALGLAPGSRVLDVGCGPGRHAHALVRRGIEVLGVDVARRFVDLARQNAPPGASFVVGDARAFHFEAEFDGVISLCQGAFGLSASGQREGEPLDPDIEVLAGMTRALRPGGLLALTAFSAYFQVRFLGEEGDFDAGRGVHYERAVVRNEIGAEIEADLWTTCYTARELRLMAGACGLEVLQVSSVGPGEYALRPIDLERPEILLIARRPRP